MISKNWMTIIAVIILFSIGYNWTSKSFYPKFKHESRISKLQAEEEDIRNLMNSMSISDNFIDSVAWSYSFDYSSISKIASTFYGEAIEDEFNFIFTDDKFYQRLLLYHSANKCFLTPLSKIENDTSIYQLLDIEYDMNSSDMFYIACPIYADYRLFGYVSGILQHGNTGVVAKQNLISVLTYHLGKHIRSL